MASVYLIEHMLRGWLYRTTCLGLGFHWAVSCSFWYVIDLMGMYLKALSGDQRKPKNLYACLVTHSFLPWGWICGLRVSSSFPCTLLSLPTTVFCNVASSTALRFQPPCSTVIWWSTNLNEKGRLFFVTRACVLKLEVTPGLPETGDCVFSR